MSPFTRRWISPKECAEYLHLHVQTVYSLFYKGKILGGRVGGVVRLDRQAIDQMLEGKGKKS
jgi:excisionase family DNA binding protein